MDQQKIGAFLKELRKEKNITQEQLADEMRVSRRTVSRWETGSNMPDLAILIDLSEYYNVDLKDILNGQRKSEDMDKELKDTVLKAAEYSNDDKEKMNKRFHFMFLSALVFLTIAMVAMFLLTGPASDIVNGTCLGVGYGMVVVGAILTSRYARKIRDCKMRLLGRK